MITVRWTHNSPNWFNYSLLICCHAFLISTVGQRVGYSDIKTAQLWHIGLPIKGSATKTPNLFDKDGAIHRMTFFCFTLIQQTKKHKTGLIESEIP